MSRLKLTVVNAKELKKSFAENPDLIALSKKQEILKVSGKIPSKKGVDSLEISFYVCKEIGVLR